MKAGQAGILPKEQYEIAAVRANFPPHNYTFKILTNGDPCAGRSALIKRYVCDTFPEDYVPNKGWVSSSIIYYKFLHLNGETMCLQIWDVVSDPADFRTSASSYWRGSSAVVIIFDLTKSESLQNIKEWMVQIDRYCTNEPMRVIIGNKSDKKQRIISYEEMRERCFCMGVEYFETSAKTSYNVEEVFTQIGLQLLESRMAKEAKEAKLAQQAKEAKEAKQAKEVNIPK